MNKTLMAEWNAALNAGTSLADIQMTSWIVDRVQDMTTTWYPFVKAPSSSSLKNTTGSEKETSFMGYFVNLAADETMEIETRVCDVMEVDERTITTLFYDRFVPFFFCLVFF